MAGCFSGVVVHISLAAQKWEKVLFVDAPLVIELMLATCRV